MPSKYYSPPINLIPFTTAKSATINSDWTGVDAGFQGVASDMLLTLSHQSIALTPLSQSSLQMAGKNIGVDSTGLNLTTIASFGTWRGTYAASTPYNQGDIFVAATSPFNVYFVQANYTSSGSIATDLAANNIALAITVAPYVSNFTIINKTTTFLAAANNLYIIPSSAGFAITLPVTPAVGTTFAISVSSALTGAITLTYNGTDKIQGGISSITLTTVGVAYGFYITYTGATFGWVPSP